MKIFEESVIYVGDKTICAKDTGAVLIAEVDTIMRHNYSIRWLNEQWKPEIRLALSGDSAKIVGEFTKSERCHAVLMDCIVAIDTVDFLISVTDLPEFHIDSNFVVLSQGVTYTLSGVGDNKI